MRKIDRAALELCMVRAREGPDARGDQLDRMLEGRPWEDVAGFASFHCQIESLHLKPWEMPPCLGDCDNGNGRDEQAWALLKRMRKAGISRWHPDPLEACQKAEAALGAQRE
jgi:hypothetical protein